MSASHDTPSPLTSLRLRLLANGFQPVPISSPDMKVKSAGKRPVMSKWCEVCSSADEAEVIRWTNTQPGCTNTGILTGALAGIDIDVPVHELADKIDRLAEALLQPTPLHRIGKAPKRLRCYRTEKPLPKIETPELFLPEGTKCQVEVLGAGQQFVAFGTHPETRAPYRWTDKTPHQVSLADLPVVTEEMLREFVAASETVLRKAGGRTEAEIKAEESPQAAPASDPRRDTRKQSSAAGAKPKSDFFKEVNAAALRDIGAWFPQIFPRARQEAGTGAWRVSSADLGRGLEEDISMHPSNGGRDFGTRKSCSPIDLAVEHGGAPDAAASALWLCEQLKINPSDLGWKGKKPHTTEADEVDAIMAEFNGHYMLVNEDGKAVILQPGFDPVLRRRKYDRLTPRDLQTLYLNRLVKVGRNDDGQPIFKTAADVWLRHPDRRQFIHGVEFDPGAHYKPGVLNLWEGFAVKPRPGDWSLMRDHMRDVMCAADPIRFDYLLRWIALMLQRPAQMGEVAVVLKGVEGCGKGTLARAIMQIMGGHGLAISNAKHLVGNFNAHLASTVFLFADEAFFAGDRAHVAVLKALITERQLAIEAKFANMRNQPNFLHLMMASNEEWVVPASLEARRFFVLDVLPDRARDFDYFAAIWKQMESGGYEAMLHDLLHLDLTGFNVRSVPTTEGLQQQRKLSLPTTESWWLDCLERGYVFKSRLGLDAELSVWKDTISTELLFASYSEFARARGERRPLTREALGTFFAKLGAKSSRPRRGIVGEALVDTETTFGGTTKKARPQVKERPWSYTVDGLEHARSDFLKVTGLSIQWDGGADSGEQASDRRHEPAQPQIGADKERPDWRDYEG